MGDSTASSARRDPYAMDGPRLDHKRRLLQEIEKRVSDKYDRGQAEHGGDLWLKSGMLEMAIEEAVDQLVYLLTLREQVTLGHGPNPLKVE